MKKNLFKVIILGVASVFIACNKNVDNYQSPNASLHGALLDSKTNDTLFEAYNVGTGGQAGYLQLNQLNYKSFDISTNITSDYAFDGTYTNANLFNGTYKVVPRGAFYYKDTITLVINGNTHLDIKVSPWISVNAKIGIITSNSITVTYSGVNNDSANQKMARMASVIQTTPYPDINHYLIDVSSGVTGRIIHGVDGAENKYTFTDTFTGLEKNTTYYLRVGARTNTSIINPNSYYNYSRVITFKTN